MPWDTKVLQTFFGFVLDLRADLPSPANVVNQVMNQEELGRVRISTIVIHTQVVPSQVPELSLKSSSRREE
jgi:hypothetical protein